MKGVTAIISIILILIIVVALAALLWSWIYSLATDVTEEGETTVSHLSEKLSSCILLDSVNHNKIYIRNCGQGLITNDTINIFIDDKEFNFSMNPVSINYGELSEITMPIWGMSIGDHTIKIINPKTEMSKRIEAVLDDSCVLALDFDEGSGTIIYDKSDHGNHGTLKNLTGSCGGTACPSWSEGKFSSGLDFDRIGDYIDCGNDLSLNLVEEITVELWLKPNDHNCPLITKGVDASTSYKFSLAGEGQGRMLLGTINDYTCGETGGYEFPLNIWSHILMKYNKTNIVLYINGNEDKLCSYNQPISISSTNLLIGLNSGAFPTYIYGGIIDSVRIYNKALSPEETLTLKKK